MTFTRCIVGEKDITSSIPHPTVVSTSHRPSTSSVHVATSRSSSRRSSSHSNNSKTTMIPALLTGWSRKKSNAVESPECDEDTNNNQNEPSSLSVSEQPSSPSCPSPSKQSTKTSGQSTRLKNHNTVKYHRGEKSFLDFHQNYAITRHLGEGSYSTVKQVTHRKKGGIYACKIVDKSALSAVDRIALAHEVRVLSSIQHDNIMCLYEVIEDDMKCYMILELAEHGDLFDRIVKQGKFIESEAQKVIGALVEALAYCHANAIIHRDVKPENVLLTADHNIKLCDFGFAKQLADEYETSIDSCGTPGYAAPEILDGKPYGLEVDVFSLGVVMYILLCGYPPFPMKLAQLRTHRFNVRFPSKDWNNIDKSVKELITQMLSVRPEQRPSMATLRNHPWIQKGKTLLDLVRAEALERKRVEALQRKQTAADSIRKKLITTGFEVIKHGRQGQPHKTKLRLSTDGRILSWQPKLFKRGLLKYQTAKSLSLLLGLSSRGSSNGSLTHSPRHHTSPQQEVDHPEVTHHVPLRSNSDSLSAAASRRSDPSTTSHVDEIVDVEQIQLGDVHSAMSASNCTLASSGSTNSTDSATWIDKKNWWRSLRRQPHHPNSTSNERSASGGFSFAAFSLSKTSNVRTGRASSASTSSSSMNGSDTNEEVAGPTKIGRSISTESVPTTSSNSNGLTSYSVPPSPTACKSATVEGRVLDSSITLKDIRSVVLGEDSVFFETLHRRGHENNNGDNEDSRKNKKQAEMVNVATTLTVTTRTRELHLEFATEDMRDAFAFLLEQATLPLEDVLPQQQSFIIHCPMKPNQESENQDGNDQIE